MQALERFNRDYWTRHYAPVLENKQSIVVYDEKNNIYYAVSKETKGNGYGISPFYHNFVMGDFKKCKKYFEKYSKETMDKLREELKK